MAVLPASVRLALWATAAWHGHLPSDRVVARALPDVDHVAGDLDRLELWRELGEGALFVALPRPGDPTSVPRSSPEALAAAVDAGECVFVAGIGGLLVPSLSDYGTAGDTGLRADWTAYDCDPTPRHRLEMLDLRHTERTLLESVRRYAEQLEAVGGAPWDEHHREAAEGAVRRAVWGLPDVTPDRAVRVLTLAARVAALADTARVGAALPRGPVAADATARREALLRSVRGDADTALGEAANVAVMAIAGWRPA
ncbi:MAG TPA: hypothetical protein VFJ94_06165 [Intrasporangium sp.]|uniref:hypothetical protein n=1 Tax=Intrasporangium sp. TaxID=1925024 RepID=UPI002D780865|nr:hypothetical protein [Intrasporangium sp.]HET7398089.1 hypothetical protein [Intrasporangium sp.]